VTPSAAVDTDTSEAGAPEPGAATTADTAAPPRLLLSPPDVGEAERAALVEAFDSGWIAPLGPYVDQFEAEFAARVDMPAAAALSSGTAALHLALRLVGVGPGDDVLVSTLTFCASATPIAYLGARPVFIDSERRSWNLDPELVATELEQRAARGRLPAALVTVDVLGQCADYQPLLASCRDYGIPVVEDAAEALGATYRGQQAGSFGDVAAFSFNGNKIITTSGGGMLVAHDSGLVDRARFLASQAREAAPHYEHAEIGYNYRLSNLLAAVGLAQLRSLDGKVARRRAVRARYAATLAEVPGVEMMPDADYGEPTNWLSVITVDPDITGVRAVDLRIHLEERGIEARPMWKPLHLQPAFAMCPRVGGAVAEDLFARGLCLPSGTAMGDGDVDRVIGAILERLDLR
jgi:pyridoxal phosphate-dependent aminotransferase EpsN